MNDTEYDAERLDLNYESDNLFVALMKEEGISRYSLARRILESRSVIKPSVLDAACGYGYGAGLLGDDVRYLGIDVSEAAVSHARATYPDSEFRVGDLLAEETYAGLPEFDAILSFETIEHVIAPERFLSLCRPALKADGGLLLLSAPTVLTRDWTPFHLHDRSACSWRRTIRRSGFRVVAEVPQGFTIPFKTFAGMRPSNRQTAETGVHGLAALIRRNQDVAWFLATHPRYLAVRAYDWLLRGRFRWQSRLYVCEHEGGAG